MSVCFGDFQNLYVKLFTFCGTLFLPVKSDFSV